MSTNGGGGCSEAARDLAKQKVLEFRNVALGLVVLRGILEVPPEEGGFHLLWTELKDAFLVLPDRYVVLPGPWDQDAIGGDNLLAVGVEPGVPILRVLVSARNVVDEHRIECLPAREINGPIDDEEYV